LSFRIQQISLHQGTQKKNSEIGKNFYFSNENERKVGEKKKMTNFSARHIIHVKVENEGPHGV